MARDRKTRRLVILSDPQATEQKAAYNTQGTFTTEVGPEGHVIPAAPELRYSLDVPSEIAEEVWESLRDEFYEQIEQLPLSLHRSFALIGEQDSEVQACQAELLPAIRSYVRLRQSIQTGAQGTAAQPSENAFQSPRQAASVPNSLFRDLGIEVEHPDVSGINAQRQPTQLVPGNGMEAQELDDTKEKEEISHNTTAHATPISRDTSSSYPVGKPSQSASARTQGLREADATVPRSVPFPPRPKPKTTRELLTRIAFLMGELLRASEEKVGLASAVYDSVDRHVRALDATIKGQNDTAATGLREGTRPPATITPEETIPTTNEGIDDDDEEPQLGMIGLSAEGGIEAHAAPRLRRSRKRDRRDRQKSVVFRQPPTRVHVSTNATNQEMPIDQHELRYCYCNQVSYGEMIACDNPDCIREWFHLGCAGLAAPPKGKVKWYCRDCEEALGRSRKRRMR